MTLNLIAQKTSHTDFTPRITVFGVGGGGTNAVNNMIALNLPGVEFVVANTDAQQLLLSRAERRIQLGPHITQGNGAGGRPEVGRASAEEAADELARHLDGAHMVFITAGMGGGTGTGAAPVIARMARERNILTVGVVTKPFAFEGRRRLRAAEEGIAELQQFVDTLIVIPNQNLFKVANERTGWKEAFEMADHVLYMGVRGVTDLMVVPGMINLDYADIRSVMLEMGKAMMGTGEADGEDRAIRAAEAAISNPLLEDTNMKGARGLLINITGGSDLTLFELDQAANRIREEVDEDANIMVGMALDEGLGGRVRISVVATGIDSAAPGQVEKPRLVSVGGGNVMVDAVAAAQGGVLRAGEPVLAPSEAPMMAAPPNAQMQNRLGGQETGMAEPIAVVAGVAPPQWQQPAPVRMPPAAPTPVLQRDVGAGASRPVAPPDPGRKPSLFSRMTHGFRSAPALVSGAPHVEPTIGVYMQPRHEGRGIPGGEDLSNGRPNAGLGVARFEPAAEARASVKVGQAEDIGLEIPAFLRRQQS